MKIEILEAMEADLTIVRNLIPYYIYDMSESTGWDCSENGTFGGCDDLAEYWQTHHPLTDPSDYWPDKKWKGFPHIVRVDGRLAGFALVKSLGDREVYDMGEFFILRKYRHKSIGRHAALTMFAKFKGNWEVRQILTNTPARAFWRKVVSEYTNGHFTDSVESLDGYDHEQAIQRFCSRT